jgi:hypothetical protein
MNRRLCSTISSLLLLLVASVPVFPQADASSATIRGVITDQNGAVVVGAAVTARNTAKGITRSDRSNAEGIYQITLLPPGSYELRIEASGFETRVIKGFELTVGQVAAYDTQMVVGGVTAEVQVTTDSLLIEVERSQQANTIESRQVESLPNIGRDFTSYVFTLPGVSSSAAPRIQNPGSTFGTSGFSIGGSNGRNNLVTIDGGENEYGSGQIRTNVSVEAIQEFQVNRNAFAAEFGFTAGTAVNVVTKSGSNNFHGSGYVYYRSQKTSARNFFNVGPNEAFDQRVFPGFTFGGPISKDRLFFFTSYEHLKSDSARFRDYLSNIEIFGPTANLNASLGLREQEAHLARMAASSNANIRRIGEGLRQALTTTNFPVTIEMLAANSGNIAAPDRRHDWTTRVDYQIGPNDSLNGRFSLNRSETDNLLGGNSTTAPSASSRLPVRDYTAVATWTHNFSSNIINQLRGQIVPNNSARTIAKQPDTTSLLIQGIGSFGRDFATPFNTFQDRTQIDDSVIWTRGRHNFKFGGSYRAVNYKVINELWFGGEWNFSSGVFPLILAVPAADRAAFAGFNAANGFPINGPPTANLTAIQAFNFGLPLTYRQGFNNPEWQDWAHYLGLFAQDSWKVNSRFTIDYGVRFDYDAEPAPLTANGYLSPRLGFAWDPWGDQKTVIRGGGGLFYAPVNYQVVYVTNLLNDSGEFINQIFRLPSAAFPANQQPAAIWAAGRALGKLPSQALSEADVNALGIATGQGSAGRVVFDVANDYANPYSIQASLGITRQLVGNLALDVAYQMYRSVHLQVPHEVNFRETGEIIPGIGPRFAPIDPTIAQSNLYSSIGNSIYHGMTASLTKRFSRGLQFQVNYTYSKAIDDITDFNSSFAAAVPTRLDLERSDSTFDIRHNFVASAVYETPFQAGSGHNILARAFADITLSPIVFMRSGIPFTIRIGRDVNGDNHSLYDRPFGAARNTGRGDNFYSFDMRLMKKFFINRDSGVRVDFLVEGTNLLNRTNFSSVFDVFGTDPRFLFGPFNLRGSRDIPRNSPLGFSSAFAGRQIQFGLKVAF